MRRTVLATIAVFLVLVPAAGAAEPRIAAGVSAAGTDVSGLTLPEAAGRLYEAHGFTVGKPLSTHVAGRKFAVNPGDLGFVYDVNKTARRAYNAGVAPHTGPVDVALYTAYDAEKVTEYANKVASTVKKDPRDARVDIGVRRIGKVASKDGRADRELAARDVRRERAAQVEAVRVVELAGGLGKGQAGHVGARGGDARGDPRLGGAGGRDEEEEERESREKGPAHGERA